jgi:hypothetical protein
MIEHSDDRPEFKICSCPVDWWEVIVVNGDENFEDRSTVYHHCSRCSEDYAVIDYDTDEILYLYPMLVLNKSRGKHKEKYVRLCFN